MNISDIGVVVGVVMSVGTVGGVGGKYYMDHEYITIGSFEQYSLKKEIREIRKDIRALEYKKKKDGLNEYEQFQLDQLYRDQIELNGELAK